MELKCLICDQRPRYNGSLYCQQCGGKLATERRERRPEPVHRYLIYQGVVAGLYLTGKDAEGDNTYAVRFVKSEPETLPKSITLDLDHYCAGCTREDIKRYKAMVKSVGAKVQVKSCQN